MTKRVGGQELSRSSHPPFPVTNSEENHEHDAITGNQLDDHSGAHPALPTGLHLRVAAVIVTMAKLFHSIISFVSGSQRADAKSILSLLRLGAVGKAPLVLTASGQDADRAIRGLGDPFESKRVLCKDAGQLAHARWEDG